MTMQTCNTPTISLTAAKSSRSVFSNLRLALALRHQRKELRHLDSVALTDLGLTRAEAKAEAARPFWDVPANWRG